MLGERVQCYHGDDALKAALAATLTARQSKLDDGKAPFDNEDLEDYLAHGSETEKGFKFALGTIAFKTLFTTASGHLGIGTRLMEVGDKICVLFGGEVLFILRPAGENYKLVGECYVHGLMHGEAMEMLGSGEAREQFFDLC